MFLVAEDAAGEAGEVAVWAGDEAGDAGEVDDVGADVQGEGEGVWFHVACLLACWLFGGGAAP